jgi:hypothetical protein
VSDFEFYFSYYGLLLGLSVAAVIGGLARALNGRGGVRIGALTPLLALFVLLDITSFWLLAWDRRETLEVGWFVLFGGLATAGTYYLAASLVFPSNDGDWLSLEEHYWARKRLVVGGVLAINAALMISAFVARPPEWDDWLAMRGISPTSPADRPHISRRKSLDLACSAGDVILLSRVRPAPSRSGDRTRRSDPVSKLNAARRGSADDRSQKSFIRVSDASGVCAAKGCPSVAEVRI